MSSRCIPVGDHMVNLRYHAIAKDSDEQQLHHFYLKCDSRSILRTKERRYWQQHQHQQRRHMSWRRTSWVSVSRSFAIFVGILISLTVKPNSSIIDHKKSNSSIIGPTPSVPRFQLTLWRAMTRIVCDCKFRNTSSVKYFPYIIVVCWISRSIFFSNRLLKRLCCWLPPIPHSMMYSSRTLMPNRSN
jgi:hypothetical protein